MYQCISIRGKQLPRRSSQSNNTSSSSTSPVFCKGIREMLSIENYYYFAQLGIGCMRLQLRAVPKRGCWRRIHSSGVTTDAFSSQIIVDAQLKLNQVYWGLSTVCSHESLCEQTLPEWSNGRQTREPLQRGWKGLVTNRVYRTV